MTWNRATLLLGREGSGCVGVEAAAVVRATATAMQNSEFSRLKNAPKRSSRPIQRPADAVRCVLRRERMIPDGSTGNGRRVTKDLTENVSKLFLTTALCVRSPKR